jgi:hypothetical protein
VAAWLVRGALAIESAAPGAAKVGILPPWWELALFILAGACAVFLLKPTRDRVMPLFITVLCILPWVPGIRSPALLMWTGPLAVAVWIAAAIATALPRNLLREWFSAPGRLSGADPILAGVAAFVFFAAIGYGSREMVPGGDEPHYLIIAQSLLQDGDLQIENNHARRDYQPYFQGVLRPDYYVRGTNGAIYSIHAPGLPALIAPAFALGGYRAVVLLILLVYASGVALVWRLAFSLTRQRSAAWFAAVATATATPIAFQSFTIYPDGLGAVLVLTGAAALLRLRPSESTRSGSSLVWALHGLALALLPWIHTRFAILAGLLGIFILLRMPRTREGFARAAAFLAFPVVLGIAWFAYFRVIYGTFDPGAPYGDFFKQQASWSFVTGGLAGVLFDQQFGMMTYAPVLLLAFVGWIFLLRSDRRFAIELAIIVIPYLIATTHLRMWWGGWSTPARFSVAVLWLASLPIAVAWSRARTRAARGTAIAALLVSAFTTVALAAVDGGRMAYNVRDGYSLWLHWLSPLGDLPLGFPSFFRWLNAEWAFHAQILAGLGLFASGFWLLRILDRRVRGTGAFTLVMFAVYAVAGMAMVSVLWKVNDSVGVRAAAAQLRLLRAAQGERRIGVAYGGGVRASRVDTVLQRLRIDSPPRMLGGADPPALVLPGWFPAGRYRIVAATGPPSTPAPSAAYELRILRSGTPILVGPVPRGHNPLALDISLPVDVPAVILRGAGLKEASLTPVHVATRRQRFGAARAESARRYGAAVVWFLDGDAFNEPEGLWVRGGAETELLLQPDNGNSATLLLRNGAAPNEIELRTGSGEWKEALSMRGGEEREVQVPVDPDRGAALLRVIARNGFRPSEVNPGSNDTRYLGVWIAPR